MLDRFLKKNTKFFKEITKFFKGITKFFKEITKFFKEIAKFFKRISKFFKRITIYSKELNPKHSWMYNAIMTIDLINVVLLLKRYTMFLLFHYYLLQLLKRYTKFLLFWKIYSFFIVLPSFSKEFPNFSKKNLYYYYSKDVHNVPTISHMHIQKDNFYQRAEAYICCKNQLKSAHGYLDFIILTTTPYPLCLIKIRDFLKVFF